MKIKIVLANTSKEFFEANVGVRQALATPEMELLVVNLKRGPESVEGAYDDVFSAMGVVEQVATAKEEGCDAVVIDCAMDPGLRAARELTDIPVVGAGEASHLTAMMLCNKFSIVTVLPVTNKCLEDNIRKYGLEQRVASIRTAFVPVLDLGNEEVAAEKLYQAAKVAIEQDGAEAIVLGCTGMIAMRGQLEKRLGVPVVEPLTCGVQMAATLVRMGLTHSKIAYETPTQKIRT